MGETRVDLLHLLKDLRDAYPGSIEETIVTEMVANALDSGATTIQLMTDSAEASITVVDNGRGMLQKELRQYHDIAATTKSRGGGIGFAGVGIKLGLLISDEVFTETRVGHQHIATTWRLSSKRRAPWDWVTPEGLVGDRGTGVRLRVRNALSPLVDSGYVEELLYRHFQPLFDPAFEQILSGHYPNGIGFVINGRTLPSRVWNGAEKGAIAIKPPRKRKPSAMGFLVRQSEPLPEDQRGIAISTFGKVIKRGWDWVGITPAEPDEVGGLIEAPMLAQSLTLNKADFIRVGTNGAPYVAFRKAIQEAVASKLAEWGISRERPTENRRRSTRPMERDLEKVLLNMADDFPLLSTLIERRTGGQRRLPLANPADEGKQEQEIGGPIPATQGVSQEQPDKTEPPNSSREPAQPPSTTLGTGVKRSRRPTRYRLRIQFEQRAGSDELSRLVESTVLINEAHPAYNRAVASRATGYHIALATAMALVKLAVEPGDEHSFITSFLVRWGEATQQKTTKKRRRTKSKAKTKR